MNTTVVEVVKFVSQGLPEVIARTQAMANEVNEATQKQKILLGLLADPRYERHLRRIEGIRKEYELIGLRARNAATAAALVDPSGARRTRAATVLNQQYERMTLSARNVAAAQGLADGSAAKHLAATTKLNQQYDRISLRTRNAASAQGLADGSTARQIRSVTKLNEEYARMQRHAELTARFGDRLGGFLARHGSAMSRAGGAIGFGVAGIAGAGMSLARQGFQGTVQQAALQSELTMIGRELAGALRPITDLFTRGARSVRERLEKTNETGQNAVMGGLLAGGTAAGAIALRSVAHTIGLVAGETTAARLRASAGRAAVGGLGAAALGYGLATGNVTSGALGGAMVGFSMGGPVGAVVGGIAGGVAAKAASTPDARPGEKPFDYYRRMRTEHGMTGFGAAAYTALEAPSAMWRGMVGGETGRREVQPAGGGFESAEQYYARLSGAIEKREAERSSAPEAASLVAVIREFIVPRLEEIAAARRAGAPPLVRPGGAR